jgi:predicted enzyme related to lactoylglutathione lyase
MGFSVLIANVLFVSGEGLTVATRRRPVREDARMAIEYPPGTPSWCDVNTPDVDASARFYGSLFGWRTLALDRGPEMWTLSGFGDFLERDNADLRKQMAEAGAPKGFEDVVASINPIAEDQPDTPAHWSVTFAVDNADATAAKAAERGGKVIVPPFDAPWVRMTVIGDPQGAAFIASKFVPENKDLGSQTG